MRYVVNLQLLLLACASQIAFSQTPQVVAISHRGEHLRHPENTLPAFQAAIDAGADFIEVDVRTTSDGRLVLMHDATVDRCTNGHGEVAKMTFEEIRRDFRDEVIAVVKAAKLDLYVDRLGPADTPQSWEDAVRRGATGIQSDHPAELVEFLRAKGWHK